MNIKKYVSGFKGLKILVIGDVMIDSYLIGSVNRISPEAPVPIVNVKTREKRLGGAANVALNLKELGATPIICSIIGNDNEGTDLINLLKEKNIASEHLVLSDNRKTTVKHRIISGSQQLLRVDSEDDVNLTKKEEQALVKKISSKIEAGIDAIIFEDYDKGVLSQELIQNIASKAKKSKIPTIVDPKKRNFWAYKGVTLFKPNLKEISEGLNIKIDTSNLESIEKASHLVKEKLDVESLIVTLSEKGIWGTNFKEKYHVNAMLREVADVSGAGDTVVSILALCAANNIPLLDSIKLSNYAAGIVCQQLGVVPINVNDLINIKE